MKNYFVLFAILGLTLLSCTEKNGRKENSHTNTMFTGEDGEVRLIVLAPGHFHANLLQKRMMDQVSDTVFVYAPKYDAGLEQYLAAIESFNQRSADPTHWQTVVYTGEDYLDKMISDKNGNVVVLAGNNRDKSEYILAATEAGLNVLSDKPMAINQRDFYLLEKAYSNSQTKNVLLYDMMTERYDMLNIIEKELINDHDFFGELVLGTADNPAVDMESVHHFYKEVSGKPLIRPTWYYDVEQQGEGLADVTTHLIDLFFWKCFSNQSIDYKRDIGEVSSAHWPTEITLSQFSSSTNESVFPDYLHDKIDKDILKVNANGTLRFIVKNHYVRLKVLWNWQAPEGTGDKFSSEIRGTKAVVRTSQNKEQNFVKQLYVVQPDGVDQEEFEESLKKVILKLQQKYSFLSYSATDTKGVFMIHVPEKNREGHESHFTYVGECFFNYLVKRDMPEWERFNTLAKYYITTKAVENADDRN